MFFGKAEREKENSFNVSSNLERTEVRNAAATARRSDFSFLKISIKARFGSQSKDNVNSKPGMEIEKSQCRHYVV